MIEDEYEFRGYFDDDADHIYNIITENWGKGEVKDKTLFFFDELGDPAAFNFKTGEIAVKIYADEVLTEYKGISFDSASSSRAMRIDVRALDRESVIQVVDEIKYILSHYRIRPFGHWQTMNFSASTPVYPSYKIFHTNLTFTLKQYYTALPRVDINGISRYSRRHG